MITMKLSEFLDPTLNKEWCKCAEMEYGKLCVALAGTAIMLELLVVSLDSQKAELVGNMYKQPYGNYVFLFVAYYPYRYSRFGSWSYRENAFYQCNGTEESLSECRSRYTSCSRYNVAGIYCEEIDEEEDTPECENDSVRLVNGNGSHEGRVEVCYNGTWSSLCSINTETAGVVCEKLGYSNHASNTF